MSALYSIELSLTTLILLFTLPAAYFLVHALCGRLAKVLYIADLVLSTLCALCAVLVLFKLATSALVHDWNFVRLHILHMAPLMLTLLIVQHRASAAAGSSKERQ